MKDVQSMEDARGIAIERVGISKLYLPFSIADEGDKIQNVTVKIEKFTASLDKDKKGTHMSRFMEILHEYVNKPLNYMTVDVILTKALQKLSASSAQIDISFKYFFEVTAPVSKKQSLLDIDCRFSGQKSIDRPFVFTLTVSVPVMSLCPCSKEISDYGAHNQRSTIRVEANLTGPLSIRNLVALLQQQASSAVYPLLKRADEKYVTEAAYDNPKFVEDILRDTVIDLHKIEQIEHFKVECENYESIHNHNAYASFEG